MADTNTPIVVPTKAKPFWASRTVWMIALQLVLASTPTVKDMVKGEGDRTDKAFLLFGQLGAAALAILARGAVGDIFTGHGVPGPNIEDLVNKAKDYQEDVKREVFLGSPERYQP